MQNRVTTGVRVFARKGALLPVSPGKKRSKRAYKSGKVISAVGPLTWRVVHVHYHVRPPGTRVRNARK